MFEAEDVAATVRRATEDEVPTAKPVAVQRVSSTPPMIAFIFPWIPAAKPVVVSARLGSISGTVTDAPLAFAIRAPVELLELRPLASIVMRFCTCSLEDKIHHQNY